MAIVRAVERAFERIAPLSLAASWDNVGLLLSADSTSPEQRSVVLTIDLTPEVFEALPLDTACIVAYHPPIFRGLTRLTHDDPIQRTLLRCAARNIAIYSPHSCLDAAVDGIDYWLASAFAKSGIQGMQRIKRSASPPPGHDLAGEGMIIELDRPLSLEEAVDVIKTHLRIRHVLLARSNRNQKISSIALGAGSGYDMLRGCPADLYWTGEMRHHDTLAAIGSGHHVVLCNHSDTERGFLSSVLQGRLQQLLTVENPGWNVSVSPADRDPLEVV